MRLAIHEVRPSGRGIPTATTWLEHHPGPRDKNGNLDPDATLWPPRLQESPDPIDEDTLWFTVKRLAKRAGIRKRVHAHGFRHTRATHLAKVLTDGQMRAHFGWGRTSPMPAHYAHLSGRDTEDALLQEAGMGTPKPRPDPLRVRPCGNCGQPNSPTAVACHKCNRPLGDAVTQALYGLRSEGDAVVAEVLRRLMERVPQAVEEVIQDPAIRDRLTALEKRSALASPE